MSWSATLILFLAVLELYDAALWLLPDWGPSSHIAAAAAAFVVVLLLLLVARWEVSR